MTMHRELRTCELVRLEKFRPRRARHNGRATFWKALRLLVLSALCGAAWSAGKAAESLPHAQPLTQRERAEGVWIAGGLLLGLMALVALAVRKQGRESRGLGEAYAEEDPYAGQWASRGRSDSEPLKIEKSKMEIGEPWDVGPLESLSEDRALELWAVSAEAAMGQIEREHECDGDGCSVCDALTSVAEAPLSPSPSLTVSPAPTLPAEIVKPAKHGFVIDLQDGDRRTQVRVFEFERQEFLPGQFCEMPVTLSEREAVERMREAMRALCAWQPETGGQQA